MAPKSDILWTRTGTVPLFLGISQALLHPNAGNLV